MTPEFRFVVDAIKEAELELTGSLSENRVTSFEEYKFICGKIRGLRIADQIVKDLAERLEHDDDS